MKDIIAVIRTTLEIEISKLLSSFVSCNHAVKEQNKPPDEALYDDDIDMDFIGG